VPLTSWHNRIVWITIQQGFSGLKTAYLITFAEYFTLLCHIMVCGMPKKTGQHNKTSFKAVILIIKKRVNRIWLSCVLDLLLVRRFSCIGCHKDWQRVNRNHGWKICADVVFYFLTIMNYGVMKRKNFFKSH
jgi:hypothetical protein